MRAIDHAVPGPGQAGDSAAWSTGAARYIVTMLLRYIRAFAALVVVALLSACAGTPQLDHLDAPSAGLPARAEVADVPFYPQKDLYCGPAALAMALTWSGQPTTQDAIAEEVYTPGREGTLRSDIVGGARRNGRLAVPVPTLADLLGELAGGHPVIVFQNLGLSVFPQWHYAVAIGYDLDAGEIYLHSGTDARRATALSTFERTWQRGDYWALVVLPPDTMPATGRLAPTLAAAAGLERADRLDAAAQAYRAIAAHWPDDDAALIGLANVMYAKSDLADAEKALRDAVRRQPGSAPAWNNLAVVLGERGNVEAAIAAANKAIELDSASPTYRRTLEELRAKS